MTIQIKKISIIISTLCCFFNKSIFAQKDTIKQPVIDITSSYKPVLGNAVKINFSASHLSIDSSRPNLTYHIPAQNLFYAYQPIPLKPLALQQDTNLYIGSRNFLKMGFGNFSTPYVNAAVSFGNGKKFLANVYGDYISSKGRIMFQDYAFFNIKATGSYFTPKNEVYGAITLSNRHYNLYGYDHSLYNYTRKEVQQRFSDVSVKTGVRNIASNWMGINYNPSIEVNNLVLKNKMNETSFIIHVPVEKQFGKTFALKAEAKADITSYTTKDLLPSNIKINNNIFQLSPSIVISSPRFKINGGITPTWDNGKLILLPNVYAEAHIQQQIFLIQAGWIGRYTKNTLRNLSAVNPYLARLTEQINTKEIEYYGRIKATIAKHFNFSGKVGWVQYKNLPFFINDTATDNKAFLISNETRVHNLRFHADMSYVKQEKFTLTAGITFNGYVGMKTHERAWNTVPMEFTSSLRWWAFKKLMLKADWYAFGGGYYLEKGNVGKRFKPGSDLSAGAEYKINKMFSAWLDINNIFNNRYERWRNYEVLGLNVIGGVKVSF